MATTWESPAATGEQPARRRGVGARVGTALALAGAVGVGIVVHRGRGDARKARADCRRAARAGGARGAAPFCPCAARHDAHGARRGPGRGPRGAVRTVRTVRTAAAGRRFALGILGSTPARRGRTPGRTGADRAEGARRGAAPRPAIKLDPNPY